MWLLAMGIASLEKSLVKSFANFWIGLSGQEFYKSVRYGPCILWLTSSATGNGTYANHSNNVQMRQKGGWKAPLPLDTNVLLVSVNKGKSSAAAPGSLLSTAAPYRKQQIPKEVQKLAVISSGVSPV